MLPEALHRELKALLGPTGLLTDPAAGRVYAHDASHLTAGQPAAVALPATPDELRGVVALCAAAGVPLVTRGSGTGLAGGAVPAAGAVVLGTGRLLGLDRLDVRRRRVRAEAGVLNEQVSRRMAPHGLHFAPDPSSQSAATIGGNIATNAGGPHCLRHGVTLQHLARLEWVGSDGQAHVSGRGATGERGLDLVSLLCGSEGTLGVVTAATLGLVANPPRVATLLAFFPVLDEATGAVVRLLGEGLLPVAVEMVDQAMLVAVEAAFGFGFPTDVEAAMIAEFCGPPEAVAEDSARAEALLRDAGARDLRRAADVAERAELWKCRKKAFGAVGRLAPSYVTMDVVVPLGQLPDFVREIQVIKGRHAVEIATAFHAGDGNLHPGVHYDDRDPAAGRRAHAAADEIIGAALARGGSVSGEHGIGLEKRHVLPWQLDTETLRLHHEIKRAWDPAAILNPGKMLPDSPQPAAALKPVPDRLAFQWASLTVTVPAETRLSVLQDQALARGLWLPVGLPGSSHRYGLGHDPTIAELLDDLAVGPALQASGSPREYLLEIWAETGDGKVFHSGAPVFKNVAGYDLHHMLCGSGGQFVRHLAASFQLRPCPQQLLMVHLSGVGDAAALPAALVPWLAERADQLAAAQAVCDRDCGTHVLVAGRDRTWDLARVPAQLRELLRPVGGRVTPVAQVPFAAAADLLQRDLLPPWAVSGPDWTSLAPLAASGPTPAGLARERFIFQGGSGRIWVPGPCAEPPGWFADPVVVAGAVREGPPPAAGVPRELLGRLKDIFDPHRKLATPGWLSQVAVTHGR